jgi:hypothetical protein
LIGGGIAAAVLLIGLLGLWAGGVFRLKTPEGTLVVEVNVPNPDVYVDGGKMTVSWDKDGKRAEIRVQPGTREVVVTKDGFSAFGEQVALSEGQHRVLRARLEKQPEGGPGVDGESKRQAMTPPRTQKPDAKNRAAAWKQGSVWTGTGEQNPGGRFDIKIIVLKRDGDAFEGRYEVFGGQNSLLIKGTVSESGAVAWRFARALHMKSPAVNPEGAKFEGKISGETASVPYTWADHPWPGHTTPGKLELKLKGD